MQRRLPYGVAFIVIDDLGGFAIYGKRTPMIDICISESAQRIYIPVPERISLSGLAVAMRDTTDGSVKALSINTSELHGYTLVLGIAATDGVLYRGEWEYSVSHSEGNSLVKVCEGLARVYEAEGDSIVEFQNDLSFKQYGE